MPTAPLELETARLKLRQLRESDLDTYAAIFEDPEVMRYLGDGKPLDRPNAWRSLATVLGHWQLRGYGFWALEEKSTGRLLGRAGLWRPEGWPGLEVGWSLGRAHWGQGFATEAAQASLQVAFEQLGATEVCSVIVPENARSIRVAERVGERFWRMQTVMGLTCALYRVEKPRR